MREGANTSVCLNGRDSKEVRVWRERLVGDIIRRAMGRRKGVLW